MAGSFSTACANKILDHVVGKTSFTMPAAVYVAAFTTACSDAAAGTECTGGSYARKQITPATDMAAAGSRAITNALAITFVTATGSWGDVVAIAAFDDPSAGNYLWWDGITTKSVGTGDILEIAAGDLDISIAAGS